jgi:tetratricopeptide (TPR) repeat protein
VYREAIRLRPDYGCAYENLGIALTSKGKLDQAVTALKEAVRLGPANHARHHDNLGVALALKGGLDEAITSFKEAIRLQPDLADAHSNLGEALRYQGKLDEAIACYHEAIRLQPDLADAHDGLAWLLATCHDAKIRDIPRAVALARRAVGQEPQQRTYWSTLGAAHYRAGDWKAAVAALERARELGNGGDASWFFLAMARWQLGDKEQARRWYGEAVAWMDKEKPPQDEELKRFRAEAAGLLGIGK